MEVTPSDTLTCVNMMLRAVGRSEVGDLTSPLGSVDRDSALKDLQDTAREVQAKGWWFNDEYEYPLEPTNQGTILLPNNAAKLKAVYPTNNLDLVERGRRLYDRYNKTFVIDQTVYVDMTVLLDFEDLPEVARWYIAVKASRRFGTNKVPDMEQFRFSKVDEDEALIAMEQAQSEHEKREPKTSSPHVQRMRRR